LIEKFGGKKGKGAHKRGSWDEPFLSTVCSFPRLQISPFRPLVFSSLSDPKGFFAFLPSLRRNGLPVKIGSEKREARKMDDVGPL